MQTHRLSRFARTVPCGDVTAVFHQLHPSPLYISTSSWEGLIAPIPAIVSALTDALVAAKLLVQPQDDDAELTKYRALTQDQLSRPNILYLMLAQGCNNACTYCPIPQLAKKHGEHLLSFESAVAGIRLWASTVRKYGEDDRPYYIIFYGGEPLLNKAVFVRLVAYIAAEKSNGNLPRTTEMLLTTNGLLVDEEVAQLAQEHNILLVVGIDGTPDRNDVLRVTAQSGPTSQAVESAVRLLRKKPVRLAASVTLTPASVYEADQTETYLASLGIFYFGYNVLKGLALRNMLNSMPAQTYYTLAAHAVARSLGRSDMEEYQLTKRVNALTQGLPFSVDCTCYGNQIVVQADGIVTNCPFLRIEQGHIQSMDPRFVIADTETVRAWRRRIPWLADDGITGERMNFLYSGGCAFGSNDVSGGITAPDTGAETFNTEIMHAIVRNQLPEPVRAKLQCGTLSHWGYRGIGAV